MEGVLAEDDGDETAQEALVTLPPEDLLLRWTNYHLKKAGIPGIDNLGASVMVR